MDRRQVKAGAQGLIFFGTADMAGYNLKVQALLAHEQEMNVELAKVQKFGEDLRKQ